MKARNSVSLLAMGIFFLFSACSSLSTKTNDKRLRFDQVESLRVGLDDMESSGRRFGAPDLKAKLSGEGPQEEAWLYFYENSRATRLSLVFDSSSRKLLSVGWFIREGDPEHSIDYVKNRYKQKFVETDVESPVSHVIPVEKLLIDDRTGLQIEYDPTSETVNSISWHSSVSRELARDQGERFWKISESDLK